MKFYLEGGDTDKMEFINLRREIWLMHTDTHYILGNTYSRGCANILLCLG